LINIFAWCKFENDGENFEWEVNHDGASIVELAEPLEERPRLVGAGSNLFAILPSGTIEPIFRNEDLPPIPEATAASIMSVPVWYAVPNQTPAIVILPTPGLLFTGNDDRVSVIVHAIAPKTPIMAGLEARDPKKVPCHVGMPL
jgi:hypothetical protein